MSINAVSLVLNHSRAKGTVLTVLLGIANHAGTGGAWPTVETLARYGRCSERRVQQALKELVEMGELTVDRQAGGTRGYRPDRRPNLYTITLTCPATCDGTTNHRDRAERGEIPSTNGVKHVSPRIGERGEAGFTQTVHTEPSNEPMGDGQQVAEIVTRAWADKARGTSTQKRSKVETVVADALANDLAAADVERALATLAADGDYISDYSLGKALKAAQSATNAPARSRSKGNLYVLAADRKHTADDYKAAL